METPKKLNESEQRSDSLNAPNAVKYDLPLWKRLALAVTAIGGIYVAAIVAGIFLIPIIPLDGGISIDLLAYAILFLLLLVILGTDIPKLFYHFKGLKPYIAGVLGFILVIFVNFAYESIINLFYQIEDNMNQNEIVKVISAYPVASLIILGFVGPLCEELGYRTGLFGAINKWSKVIAYIVAPIIFGIAHFNIPDPFTVNSLINEFINLPMYIFSGLVFCYLYDHYGFASSYTAHALNNISAVLSIIWRIHS